MVITAMMYFSLNFHLTFHLTALMSTTIYVLYLHMHINDETKSFFQLEIIINVFVTSFRFIWIPMLTLSARGLY